MDHQENFQEDSLIGKSGNWTNLFRKKFSIPSPAKNLTVNHLQKILREYSIDSVIQESTTKDGIITLINKVIDELLGGSTEG